MAISIILVVKVIIVFHEKGTFAPLALLAKAGGVLAPRALPLQRPCIMHYVVATKSAIRAVIDARLPSEHLLVILV